MRVKYTIEPSWTTSHLEGVITLDDESFEGMDEAERDKAIEGVVSDQVNNDCPWGFEVIE